MYWLTSGIETNVAYGTCTLLFGLLFLTVRNRKLATGIQYSDYPSPLRVTARPAPKNKSAQVLRGATTPIMHSGPHSSKSLESTPLEKVSPNPPERSANQLTAPLDFPALPISEGMNINGGPIPFEDLGPDANAEISAFEIPATALTIPENVSISMAEQSFAEFGERSTQEIAIARESQTVDESTSGTAIVAEGTEAEHIAVEEVASDPQALPVASSCEKAAATDVLSFYGLPQQPFDVTPDPAYLYFSPSHREALTSIKEGIEYFRGFMVLVAEPGMGKTTLLQKLMEDLSDSARIVFLFQTQCSSRELLCFILNELEVDHTGMDIVAMHRALNQALLEEMLRGRRFVLIVDEAQNLQEPVLETIRLLSDFETTHSKLIQIVLAGQPQLADTLMRPGLVQLRQRIAVLANLEPLDAVETAEYIEHRLRAAGSADAPIFSRDAMALIAERSQGIPRSINNICFNAMLAGYLHRQVIIDSEIVRRVASKLDLELLVRRPQQDAPVSAPPAAPAASNSSSELSQLAQLLSTALAVKPQPDAGAAVAIEDEPKASLSLTGRLNEKVTSQSWSNKNEFQIQVSLERDYSPGLAIADHYYCRSFYVSEEQAKGLEPGKPVRVKFEQD